MKQFLRLLLTCFGLLILLGLNEKESGVTNTDLLATGIHTRILSTRDRYMEYFPDIRNKTGQSLHLAAQEGEPLPA